MGIKEKVSKDVTDALKAGDKARLSALRMLLSALKNKEIELRPIPMTDEDSMQVVQTLIRQRNESIVQFRAGGRLDLATKEEEEIKVLKAYLPEQISGEELKALIKRIAGEIKASGMKDMGRLMKEVMPRVKGRAEGKLINDIVKEILSRG